MRTQNTYVRARIDEDTKKQASKALDEMGLSVSDAIRLMMLRIADEHRLPFEVKSPNAKTKQAIDEVESDKAQSFKNIDELMDDLNAGD